LAQLAKKFHTSIDTLRAANQLSSTLLRPHMALMIPNLINVTSESALALLKKSKPIAKVPAQTLALQNMIKTKGKYILQPGDTIYMIRQADTMESIAKRFKVNAEMVALVNQLNVHKLTPGQKIIIPTHPIMTANRDTLKKSLPENTIYMVKRGDTVENVAKKFKVSATQLRVANLMPNSILQEGDRLTIPARI